MKESILLCNEISKDLPGAFRCFVRTRHICILLIFRNFLVFLFPALFHKEYLLIVGFFFMHVFEQF